MISVRTTLSLYKVVSLCKTWIKAECKQTVFTDDSFRICFLNQDFIQNILE